MARNIKFVVVTIIILAGIGVAMKKRAQKTTQETNQQYSGLIRGELAIGFNKGVSRTEAEKILKRYGLEFVRTRNVNMGIGFFDRTDESFIIKVPVGQERHWVEILSKEQEVFGVGAHYDENITVKY